MPYSNISKQSASIDSSEGLPIRYDLYVPITNGERMFPVILFLHGFKGFKDWGPFPDACEEISRAGFAVLAMNFSLNGVGENPMEFDRLDLFARETLSQDLEDVGTVIGALKEGSIITENDPVNTDAIGILGHSRGGQTAVAAAAEFPEIACLVTWSAVADYNERWSDEMVKDWNEKGFTEIMNSRTGQAMRVDRVVYDDARENAGTVIALNRIKDLHLPALFIHAREDESVPFREAEKLYRACPSAEKELKKVAGTGHTFGGSHPFTDDEFPGPFSEVLEETVRWFEYYLQ